MAKIYQAALAVLLPFTYAAAQQTITLNDGTQFQGRYIGGTRDLITFVDQNGRRHRFSINDIENLNFNNQSSYSYGRQRNPPPVADDYQRRHTSNEYDQAHASNGYNRPPAQDTNNQPPSAAQGGSTYATLPSGTQITVRTMEGIHASGANPGRTYPASIDRDVVDTSGNVSIPQGSNAMLVVRDMGNNQIVLDLQSVNVNGQIYALNTQDIREAGRSKDGLGNNRRTGEYVGGGAVLGTLLGAIAGGGRGAAIGAVAGAAAGAGAQVLTRGSEVRVPGETLLTFQLDQPVYLYR